jgi:hypothetical protein
LAWVRSVLDEVEAGELSDDHWSAHHAGRSGE